MKHALVIIAFLVAGITVHAKAIDWERDYENALTRAKKENKLVIVNVYTDWCGQCRRMDKETFANREVED